MADKDYKKIGMIFTRNPDGSYVYKSTEVFTEENKKIYDSGYVISLDDTKFTSLKNGEETRLFNPSVIGDNENVVVTLSENLYTQLYGVASQSIVSEDEIITTLRDTLELIANSIKKVKVETHGNVTSVTIQVNKKLTKKTEISIEENNDKKSTIDVSSINPNEVIKKIKSKVIAQDAAVESIVNNIYNNQVLVDTNDEDLITTSKANILMDGPTGTGKTLIIKEVAKELSIPMIVRSSTMYSAAGYKGSDLSEMLISLLDVCGGDLEKAQRGIIVLDEFDKLAGKGDNELEMKKAVQQELLTYISGNKFPIEYKGKTIEFDTSKLTFIALGAFTDLREKKIKDGLDSNNCYTMTEQDYIEEGLLRELVGRFSLLLATESLSKESLKEILTSSKISPLLDLVKLGKNPKYNKEIVYTDAIVDRIATIAVEKDTGARALNTVISGIRNVILADMINAQKDRIEITDEVIDKSLAVSKRKAIVK